MVTGPLCTYNGGAKLEIIARYRIGTAAARFVRVLRR